MRILCVANWSEGRNQNTLSYIRAALAEGRCAVHFDGSDPDHNRIVTAFSGDYKDVRATLLSIAEIALGIIDLRKHEGVHPRVGALDVCPFIMLEGSEIDGLEFARETGKELSRRFDLPIFLYEKSETGKHAADLPSLRRGQFEGLAGRELLPDFGPNKAHPSLGVTVLGLRNWLIAMNVNLKREMLTETKKLAREMRLRRDNGDQAFRGVRALGFDLQRQDKSQLSMNLTMPDETSPDDIIRWISGREEVLETQLIGVIREEDVSGATFLPIETQQVLRPI